MLPAGENALEVEFTPYSNGNYYAPVFDSVTLEVTPAPLTITANDATSVYGSTPVLDGVTYSGFVNGDKAASLTTQPSVSTTATSASPVGTYPTTASGAVDPNYTITYAPGTLTVTQAALTITANDATSVYGSTPVLDGVTYSGFVNGDKAASLTTQPGVSTTATSASPVGTYPTTASGAVDPNYTITYAPGTLTVTQAALTITANDATSVYGSTPVLDGVTYSGFVNGDKAASLTTQPGVSTTATSASPVGTYPTTASGAVDPNYTITYAPGTLTVTQAALTITANDATSVYGSTPVLDGVTYSGFVNGDKAASLTTQPGVSTTATSASPVGTYPTTASGAVDPNYTITYAPGTLTVTQAALTITANDATSVYGSTPVLDGVTYSGFVNGDKAASLTTQPGVSTTATSASPVGTYPTTASGAVDPNYTITYAPGTLTVTQAALTITANDATSVYGSTPVLDGVTYSGFVNGDKAASLTTQPGVSTTATSASPVGTYPTTASGAVDPNYTITYAPGTLTVTQAALTITANDATSVYGSTPVLDGVTYSGFVNGDKAASLTTQPGVSTTATSASPVGTYPTTASGAVDPNYTITYAPGTLTVTQAALTITANNATKAYGAALPTLSVSYSGFVNGDKAASLTTQPGVSTTATSASPVGTYPTTASRAVDPNYTITYAPGTLTVTQAALTITANNATKAYGAALPTLSVSYSGFVNGDKAASLTTQPGVSTTATSASPVGTYPTTASRAVDPNYHFNYVIGTLNVTPAALKITARDATKAYGAALPTLSVSYSGFVNGDTAASLTTQPGVSTTATSASPVGTYPTTASGAVDPNYTITYAPGTLTVTTSKPCWDISDHRLWRCRSQLHLHLRAWHVDHHPGASGDHSKSDHQGVRFC